MRLIIDTEDTVCEINRWEIPNVKSLIPDWDGLTALQRRDRLAELIDEDAEFCRNLEADTLERGIIGFHPESYDTSDASRPRPPHPAKSIARRPRPEPGGGETPPLGA